MDEERQQTPPAASQATPAPAPTSTPPATRRGIVWTPRLIIWTVVLVILLLFVLQNFSDKSVNILFWSFDSPLALIILVCFVLGYFLGWLRPHFRSHRKS